MERRDGMISTRDCHTKHSIPETTHLFGSELFWGRKVFTVIVSKVVVAHDGDWLQAKTIQRTVIFIYPNSQLSEPPNNGTHNYYAVICFAFKQYSFTYQISEHPSMCLDK